MDKSLLESCMFYVCEPISKCYSTLALNTAFKCVSLIWLLRGFPLLLNILFKMVNNRNTCYICRYKSFALSNIQLFFYQLVHVHMCFWHLMFHLWISDVRSVNFSYINSYMWISLINYCRWYLPFHTLSSATLYLYWTQNCS